MRQGLNKTSILKTATDLAFRVRFPLYAKQSIEPLSH
jgi:hypothetical protein